MNKLETMLAKWNFKKIAMGYIVAALIVGIACAVTVGVLYRERLDFAWQYSRLEETLKKGDAAALSAAMDKTAASSDDVVDVLLVDGEGVATNSAKNSAFTNGRFSLTRVGDEKKYLISDAHPDAIFQYVKGDEFLLRSIINKDFGKIREDFDDERAFTRDLSARTIYMLNSLHRHGDDATVYIISSPTTVAGGPMALKMTAALAMLFFCVYWVLIALWLYRDAARAHLSPLYWGLIGLFTNLVGLLVYKIYKRSLAVCATCGAAQNAEHRYCTLCGAALGAHCEGCSGRLGRRDRFCPHCGREVS